MADNFYEIRIFKALCECSSFIVNGIKANSDDFGEKFDRDKESAPDWGCGNMQFTRHTDKAKIDKCLKKYGITMNQFEEVATTLEKGLSFGCCN